MKKAKRIKFTILIDRGHSQFLNSSILFAFPPMLPENVWLGSRNILNLNLDFGVAWIVFQYFTVYCLDEMVGRINTF